MDWTESVPVFSEQTCHSWLNRNAETVTRSCCMSPNVVSVLRQDRAIDEPPSIYEECKNCGKRTRKIR